MSQPLVYLAGPIDGLGWDDAVEWRKNLGVHLKDLGIAVRDPFRGKSYMESTIRDGVSFKTAALDTGTHPLFKGHGVVHRDLWDVRTCDMIFVNLIGAQKPSIGTIIEIATAHAHDKYILVAMEDHNPHDHPFVRELASVVVDDFEEAVRLIPVILGV